MKKIFIVFLMILGLCFNINAQDKNSQIHPNSVLQAQPSSNPRTFIPADPSVESYTSRWFGVGVFGVTAVVKSFLNTPTTLTTIAPTTRAVFAGALNGAGVWFGLEYLAAGSGNLVRIDTTTGAITTVGALTGLAAGHTVTGLSWDKTSSIMYGLSTNGIAGTLYTVNLTTGALTTVANTTGSALPIDMSFNNSGVLYSVDIALDALTTINKTTGTATVVGPIGFDLNFAQGMCFDPGTDSLFLAAYNNTAATGQLMRCNTTTGAATIIGNFGTAQAEIDGFIIPLAGTPPPPTCTYGWSSQTSGTTSALFTNSSVSDLIGWAAGAGSTVRRTTDGGLTWSSATGTGITGDVYNINAWSANDALCTTSPAATFIYKTSNGGTTWTQVYTLAGGFMDAIQMVSTTEGYAMGDPVAGKWVILKTTDGGATWNRMATEPTQVGAEAGWNNSFHIVGTHMWFNTNVSTVYHSPDMGVTWSSSPIAPVTSTTYGSVHYNDGSIGIASGSAGIVKSINGGSTYTTLGTLPGTGNITALEGYGANYFWYVRGTGVFMSSNGGTNFASAYTTTGNFNDIDFSVNGCPSGWAVTSTGGIHKMTILTGISSTSEIIPDSYSLKQNYPNPFNPTTNINFSITKSGMVTLKVYDMRGKEVATLVNEVKSAGSYLVGFNASNLPSGAYFYRVTSDNFVDTKKMMLIK